MIEQFHCTVLFKDVRKSTIGEGETEWGLEHLQLHFLRVNSLMPGGNKRSYVLKQTCSFWLQLYLNTYDLLLSPGIKGLIIQ